MAHPVLQHYIKMTEFLGKVLGPDYEVVLHDLTDKNRSVIAIANNHVSGREIGAPLTNIALRFLKDKVYEMEDYRLEYSGISADGRVLRSSTMFIKHNDKLIGMLCINFDDSRYQELSSKVLELCHPNAYIKAMQPPEYSLEETAKGRTTKTESYHNSIDAVAGDAIGRELTRLGVTADRLTVEERIQVISALDADGIFLLKGAVKDVADALHCSQASVYRYLSQIKRGNGASSTDL